MDVARTDAGFRVTPGSTRAEARPGIVATEDAEPGIEVDRFDASVVEHFEEHGYRINRRTPYSFYMGAVQAVLRRRSAPGFQGVTDVRRDGTADGP